MTQLLVVETSPRGGQSVSRQMTQRFLAAWRTAHPGGRIVHRDLVDSGLSFVTAPWLQAYFTTPADQSPAMKEALQLSDELVSELLAAEHLVISTPVYNYNIPASLKAWVDHIVRKGVTLGLDGRGLIKGKKATVLMASGGVYTEGSPIRDRDIATQYLRLILGVIGIEDVTVVAGGGAKAVDLHEQTMDEFLAALAPQIQRAASAEITRQS
ncbi:FMN-dependent NADH-azoreductase [Acidovorax radicis]|jgi:FMN-dependent NADH-azoreductase|uniref:FMN-dependent NADH-azoreductase n=1 Tax=Acidovorax radicis TaxID=758826 RepID=UPI001CF847C6|nr:NAD(P)H-dependent oxidoreductase [Acidovorax radicis]UCU98541.1 NAD(P)H-dependent oxidoreductase [Acidovorax radicis]